MADRIYVTYTPTGAPGSFHTAIHYERTGLSGELIKHVVVEATPEFRELSGLEKAGNVIGEIFRTGSAPSSFGRMNAMVRDRDAFDRKKEESDDPNAPYEIIAEGDDLSGHLARMQRFAHDVNRAGFAYRGQRQNSNSFAASALRAGELPPATGVARDPLGPAGELLEFFAPGLNEPFEAPIGPRSAPVDVSEGKGNISGGRPIRYLERVIADESPSDRFGNWTSSPAGITPRNPNLPLPPAEPGKPPGIFNDKPMPLWTTPPPIRGSTDFSEAPGVGTKPMRYVSRRDGNPPPASVSDSGAPAAQFVLPDQLNASSDRIDWAAALAGLDPLYPMRAAPPQRRNDFVNGNDALSRAAGGGSSPSRPGQSQGPTASTLLEYIQHLNQPSANEPQAPGASLAPSVSPSPMGGLAGRITALSGIDPDNPDQPPPDGLLALLLAAQQR
ncbi:hypothetical protein JQ629_26130 [Bradyrhizobium sp. AUGA SZCCT0222]|uniref:hypothetical protein n=1 Tax=Bradyrhizobium sp. AUGA SZCCT0222 TaxID=2807668 RepID=UPI001BA480FE|nr:hypothetical protein [Bradyrhizobium sp. AUGA SZCCT0222]MBR1270959.1 hypothetical protein [Bradyrhizobium sp. AUGA SZCCT0222]